MANNLSNEGEPDTLRISLSEAHEVRYWTSALEVPVDELRQLVAALGNNAAVVRAHLKQRAKLNQRRDSIVPSRHSNSTP